jgi:uncharacterized protein (DUF305 family)
MTSPVDVTTHNEQADDVPSERRHPLTLTLVIILAVAALTAAAAAGYLSGTRNTAPITPPTTSVDAGFARDMSTHHQAAITMAGYTRDNTDTPSIKVLAYDIETSQYFQVGEMQGWLDLWELSRNNPTPMAWMAGHAHLQSDGLMPGMATPAQMTKLETLHGNALNIYFLQLMIRHHQGALPMLQYAQQHATESVVRDLAQSMLTAQSGEIIAMEQLLRHLGGVPLPPPAN